MPPKRSTSSPLACEEADEQRQLLAIIHLYATRNEIAHADLMILIKNGRFQTLRKRLYNDYCDIPRIISVVEGLEAKLMPKLLLHMIDRWFIRNQYDLDDVEMLRATEELEATRTKILNSGTNTANSG
ncbi:MAG: hypothetical protein M1834_007999 [Cirrosporium novae-zelandiae]|nr:MAG: hypothetical protein M1834_007999 [Cirrosporium novae-zelandiae]